MRLYPQQDGNLVLYKKDGSVIWASGTNGKGVAPYRLIPQEDGNLVFYDGNYKPLWASNTNQPRQKTPCSVFLYSGSVTIDCPGSFYKSNLTPRKECLLCYND